MVGARGGSRRRRGGATWLFRGRRLQVAERNRDLRGLLLQRDHGITPHGYDQCVALREHVAAESADPESVWADPELEASSGDGK